MVFKTLSLTCKKTKSSGCQSLAEIIRIVLNDCLRMFALLLIGRSIKETKGIVFTSHYVFNSCGMTYTLHCFWEERFGQNGWKILNPTESVLCKNTRHILS